MKDCGDLRDREFRTYLLNNISFHIKDKMKNLPIFNKKEINDSDLIQFYFAFSDIMGDSNEDFVRLIFDYKVWRIEKDRMIEFAKIVKKETGYVLTERSGYYKLRYDLINYHGFYELVDIFLDQI